MAGGHAEHRRLQRARPACRLSRLGLRSRVTCETPWRRTMKLEGEGSLLRIYLGELDKWHHQPLYEAIVLKAREVGLAGATVLRGPMGFGANSHLHTAKILRLSEDLPVLIEIVDKEDRINAFLPELDTMMRDGLVTLEKIHVIKYQGNPAKL